MRETLEHEESSGTATETESLGFNFTIDEARILEKYRRLSPHQQKGILQAIDLIRPAKASAPPAGSRLR